MDKIFKRRRFLPEMIIGCIRWYLRYPISYRNLQEMMLERGLEVDHTTLYRWVQAYAPEFEKRLRWYTKPLGFRWHVDETYIKIKGKWKYLYRAIDEQGRTLDFMLAHHPSIESAKKFFRKTLKHCQEQPSQIITDKNPSYIKAIKDLKNEGLFPSYLKHIRKKGLNNRLESDHRRVKRRIRPMLGFKSFQTANRCLKGIEAMAMIIKRQTYFLNKPLLEQNKFINKLFGIYT